MQQLPYSEVLLKVKQRANKKQGNRHPMFLLYCLLESHDLITGEKLSRVSDSVENVDEELARELDQKESLEDGGDRKPANQNIWHRLVRRKLKNAGNSRQKGTHGCDFGQLSRNLHQARMESNIPGSSYAVSQHNAELGCGDRLS